jgi:hypothetical protein
MNKYRAGPLPYSLELGSVRLVSKNLLRLAYGGDQRGLGSYIEEVDVPRHPIADEVVTLAVLIDRVLRGVGDIEGAGFRFMTFPEAISTLARDRSSAMKRVPLLNALPRT